VFMYGNTQHPHCLSPEAQLEIVNPTNPTQKYRVKAIVDSGSVITCLPESVIQRFGGLEYTPVLANTADGKELVLKKYTVHITLTNNDNSNSYEHEVREIKVLAIPGKEYALIGRDIINHHKVVLDAPAKKWGLKCQEYCRQ
jgi:hypothetical protein